MKRIGISFVAVSSKRQAEDISLEAQAEINRRNAERYDASIAYELSVPGHTREYETLFEIMEDVPAYRQLWDILQSRQADVLFAYAPDRLARTEVLLMDIAHKCWRHGVALCIDRLPPNTLDPREQSQDMGQKIMLAFGGLQSSEEMLKLRQRHRDGMRGRTLRKRRMPGKLPFGYRLEHVGVNQTRESIDPEAAKVVRWILVDLYVGAGLGLVSIADRLNRINAVTPSERRRQINTQDETRLYSRWTRTAVRNVVDRAEVYAGYIVYNRNTRVNSQRKMLVAEGRHDPIITEDELAAVLAEREERSPGPQTRRAFSGIAFCAECDQAMYSTSAPRTYPDGTKELGYYRYVRCYECHKHVQEQVIFEALDQTFARIERDSDAVHLFSHHEQREKEQYEQQKAALERQSADVQQSISNLLDAVELGLSDMGEITTRIKERRDQLAIIEDEITRLQQRILAHEQRLSPQDRFAAVRLQGRDVLRTYEDEPRAVHDWLQKMMITVIVEGDDIVVQL